MAEIVSLLFPMPLPCFLQIGATINLLMYWGLGLPFSWFLAFNMGLGAMGLWTGLACTASLQSLYLSWIVFK
jgi:MATE family multidrug resistance protein